MKNRPIVIALIALTAYGIPTWAGKRACVTTIGRNPRAVAPCSVFRVSPSIGSMSKRPDS